MIQFDVQNYNFGKAPAGQLVKHDFILTNTGGSVLEISDVRPSCGCTTAGTWQRRVEPGQTSSIPIQFNSANFAGPVTKTVTVTCNAANQPVTVLQITGTVWKPIEVNPIYVYFSVASDTQAGEVRSVRIVNNETNDITLSEPESTHVAFKGELKTVRPGKEFELLVKTVPPLAPGTIQGSISVKTSVTNMPAISISAIAMVQPPIAAVPAQIVIPHGGMPAGSRLGVTIRNNSTITNLTVSEPTIGNLAGVQMQIQEIQPGRVFNITMTFPPGFELPVGQRHELTVKTSHPQYPVIKVPVYQMPRPAQTPLYPPPVVQQPPPVQPQPARPSPAIAVQQPRPGPSPAMLPPRPTGSNRVYLPPMPPMPQPSGSSQH